MHQHYRTKAIFLKKEDRAEADQLFAVFTEDFGKIEVLGRAIRKITSKLRSGAEVFYFSEIEFIQGKNYKTLTDAILIDKFKNLRGDSKRLEIAFQTAEALDALCGKEQRDDRIWQILLNIFRSLNICKLEIENSLKIACPVGPLLSFERRGSFGGNWKLKIIYCHFLWNLFFIFGYSPQLHNCAHCHKKLLPEMLFFAPQEGGVVCWRCFAELQKQNQASAEDALETGKEISVNTVKVLRFLLKNSLEQSLKLKIEASHLANIQDISELYLNFLKER